MTPPMAMSEVVAADPEPWRPVGQAEVAHGGFLRVLLQPYVLPTGREATWELLDLPATVTVLALTPDDRVVAVRQFRPGRNTVVTSLAGGLVDEGEDPARAGARELLEETGYAAGHVEIVGRVRPTNFTHPQWVAVARDCRRTSEQSLDELEDISVVLLSVAELRAALRGGDLGATAQTYVALDHAGLL